MWYWVPLLILTYTTLLVLSLRVLRKIRKYPGFGRRHLTYALLRYLLTGTLTLVLTIPQVTSLSTHSPTYLLVLLDVSKSMGSGERFTLAQYLVQRLLERYHVPTVILAFAGTVVTITRPLTNVQELTQYRYVLRPVYTYTSIGDALYAAHYLVETCGVPLLTILITDGENNGGSDPVQALRVLLHSGARVLITGVQPSTRGRVLLTTLSLLGVPYVEISSRCDVEQVLEYCRPYLQPQSRDLGTVPLTLLLLLTTLALG